MGEAESERSRSEAEAHDLSGGSQENRGGAAGQVGESEERSVKEAGAALLAYQPIWRIRSRISTLYLFMRSGRRFRGAGRIAASRAACWRSIFRAAVPS
jgi:hypothetical protein